MLEPVLYFQMMSNLVPDPQWEFNKCLMTEAILWDLRTVLHVRKPCLSQQFTAIAATRVKDKKI